MAGVNPRHAPMSRLWTMLAPRVSTTRIGTTTETGGTAPSALFFFFIVFSFPRVVVLREASDAPMDRPEADVPKLPARRSSSRPSPAPLPSPLPPPSPVSTPPPPFACKASSSGLTTSAKLFVSMGLCGMTPLTGGRPIRPHSNVINDSSSMSQ